jgi:hypothetical protein
VFHRGRHARALLSRRWKATLAALSVLAALVASHALSGPTQSQALSPPIADKVEHSVATPRLLPAAMPAATSTTVASVPAAHPFVVIAGAPLPSGAECAKRVTKTPEVRSKNSTANHTKGKATGATANNWGRNAGANKLMQRVDGNYVGTTDEIIQWAACKWGMDADQVRAQAMVESSWNQSSVAGFVPDAGTCFDTSWRRPITFTSTSTTIPDPASVHGSAEGAPLDRTAVVPKTGDSTTSSTAPTPAEFECPTAFGIMQLRADYQPGTHPQSARSTAYNLDYALAMQRSCIEGVSWLGAAAKGDVWGCVGAFYSGDLRDASAESYIARVRSAMAARSWPSTGS